MLNSSLVTRRFGFEKWPRTCGVIQPLCVKHCHGARKKAVVCEVVQQHESDLRIVWFTIPCSVPHSRDGASTFFFAARSEITPYLN